MKSIVVIAFVIAFISCNFTEKKPFAKQPNTDTAQYVFSFKDSIWLFKGKPFKLNERIDYYVNLFGPYDRATPLLDSIYTWDKLGIMIAVPRVHPDAGIIATHLSDRLYVVFDYDFQNDKVDSNLDNLEREIWSKNATKEENDARPHPFFQGSISVGGAALHKDMTAREFKGAIFRKRDKDDKWMNFINHNALPSFYDCQYTDASVPFEYVFHVNDRGFIEEFQLDIDDDYKKENIEIMEEYKRRNREINDSLHKVHQKAEAAQEKP